MKKAAFFLASALILLSGCNTIRGAGRDLQSVGKAVEKTTN